ncbi:MAG TPA: tyrosine-type recombinase/integrase [Streptosporangiaceae bacterium]|jgi:integrase|nr:tyrosine-type recombinase/integrase [Streptosporangiaceae bacterium]
MASVRQRGNRYTALFRDSSGAQKSAGTFDTKREALKAAKRAEALGEAPSKPVAVHAASKRGKLTIAGYMPVFLSGHRLSATGRESYRQWAKRVVQGLGHITLAELSPADIRAFIRKQETEVSDATVGHVMTVLRAMCRTAVEDGLMEKDITAGVKIAPRRDREMMIATRPQARVIREAAPEHYRLLIEALFETGARYSELMGLQARDITGNVIRIRRTIVEVASKPIEQDHGKSRNAVRNIPVEPDLARRLVAAGEANDGGWVFRAVRGGYLCRATFRRVWKLAVAAAGLPGLRVHDARHSHISWLANDPTVPLAAVRDRVGHSSLAVTSRYVHTMTKDIDPCLAALAKMDGAAA